MKPKIKTKDRVLQAACEIFAKKGFRETTVAEICEQADANIAAVNYHFGDKEKLYDEVWRHAFSIASSAHPVDGEVAEDAPAEKHLLAFTNAILHRVFSEKESGLFAKLLYREMAAPTLALEQIAKEALFPQIQHLEKVIDQILDDSVDEKQRTLCKHSIIGQCVFFNFSRPLREIIIGKKELPEEEINRLAQHVTRFSLGGLKEIGETNS